MTMYRIVDNGLELEVQLGDDPPDAVENADAWLTLPDGSRWAITFMTYAEVGRLMERWAASGECLGGAYFTCSDLIVLRDPGVDALLAAVKDLVANGEHRVFLTNCE